MKNTSLHENESPDILEDLIRLRDDLSDELLAIKNYDSHILATDNQDIVSVLSSIRDEEKVHVGELTALINRLDPENDDHLEDGESETEEILDDEDTPAEESRDVRSLESAILNKLNKKRLR